MFSSAVYACAAAMASDSDALGATLAETVTCRWRLRRLIEAGLSPSSSRTSFSSPTIPPPDEATVNSRRDSRLRRYCSSACTTTSY
jgi:hypothetical protein